MIALIHIYCSTSLCVCDIKVSYFTVMCTYYIGLTNEHQARKGVAYDSLNSKTDCVIALSFN